MFERGWKCSTQDSFNFAVAVGLFRFACYCTISQHRYCDEPAGEVASEGGIKFRKVTNPFKVAELEAGDKVYCAMQLIGDKLYRSIS